MQGRSGLLLINFTNDLLWKTLRNYPRSSNILNKKKIALGSNWDTYKYEKINLLDEDVYKLFIKLLCLPIGTIF